MKVFAVAVVAVRTRDNDIRYTISIYETEAEEEAIGKTVQRMIKEYPNHLILPPSCVEITKEQMKDFLKRERRKK